MPEEDGKRRRVFFALWPGETALEGLDQLGKRLHATGGGRLMARENLHVTLAFIGEVPTDRIAALRKAAGRVAAADFSLRLDRLDCWRHRRIAWAGCSEPPLQLLSLVGQLRERLAEVGLPLETGDFTAHVTLLRDVHCARCTPLPEFAPIEMKANEFVLVESRLTREGPHYCVIGRWRLAEANVSSDRAGGLAAPST